MEAEARRVCQAAALVALVHQVLVRARRVAEWRVAAGCQVGKEVCAVGVAEWLAQQVELGATRAAPAAVL